MIEGPFRPRGPSAEPRDPLPDERMPGSPPSRRPPRGGVQAVASSATWIVGVAVLVVLAYITINTVTTDKPGSRGVQAGMRLPPFAAPLATGDVRGDANLLLRPRDGVPAACDVRGPGIFNVCQATERGPLVLGFLATRSRRCVDEVDVLDRLQARFPAVQFAAVAIRGDRGEVRRLVRAHGWTLPVAYDPDGAVSNAYAIAVCPTISFARRGGAVVHTTLGAAPEDELVRRVEALR